MTDNLAAIPPELETRPRRVQRESWRSIVGAFAGRIFILPHMIVGVVAALALLAHLLWLLLGSNVSAQATSIWTTYSSKRGTTHHAAFDIDLGGVRRSGTGKIDAAEYARLERLGVPVRVSSSAPPSPGTPLPAATLTVRTFGLRSLGLSYPASRAEGWLFIGFLAFFAAFWNGIMSLFVWAFYIEPWRRKRLYRLGLPAPGLIEDKQVKRGSKSTSYTLHYAFFTPDGVEHKGKHDVTSLAYTRAEVGQSVTVLHFEGRSKPSVVYEYGGFRCV